MGPIANGSLVPFNRHQARFLVAHAAQKGAILAEPGRDLEKIGLIIGRPYNFEKTR